MEHRTITIFAVTVAALFSCSGATLAEQLKGDAITKFLVGNTVEFTGKRNNNSGVPWTTHSWVYYPTKDTRKVKGDFRFPMRNGEEKVIDYDFETKWRVSESGQYCSTSRKGEERCKDFTVDGDTVTLTSPLGVQKGKFHKGNPKGL
jgi:hypothetical protein